MINPQAATSIPIAILRGADGSQFLRANQPNMAIDTGVSAITKQGLNCWNIGAATSVAAGRFVYLEKRGQRGCYYRTGYTAAANGLRLEYGKEGIHDENAKNEVPHIEHHALNTGR